MNFQDLKHEYRNCEKCPELCKKRTQVIFGSGNPEAQILLIGEAPGASEDKNGIPFCGMSGKILDELLAAAGLNRNDIFITNTILCRPPGNRNPMREEVENCGARLNKLLQIMQPKVIVTIGNFATERIIGKTGIKSIHGKIFSHKQSQVVPVIHPASYLYSGRNSELLQQMKDDFILIGSLVEEEKKQTSLGEYS
jgi:uracil-DNA glycosylase